MTGMDERIEWIRDESRLAALQPAWDALAEPLGAPWAGHAWYDAWWRAFGRGELAVCTLWRGAALAGAVPLSRRRRRLEALANVHSPAFSPLAADPAARRRLAAAVVGAAPELWLPGLDADDPWLADLTTAARDAGRLLHLEPQHTSPWVDLSGGWDAYRAATRKRWVAIERKRRKAGRERDLAMELLAVPAADELDERLRDGFELEAGGWKGERGTAVLSTASTAAFYHRVAHAFHARGELVLSSLHLDGELAAWDLTLRHGDRLHLLKTAYDEEERVLAPGLALRLSVVERCAEDRLRAHELLGDDTEWKRRFSTGERRHVALAAYARRV